MPLTANAWMTLHIRRWSWCFSHISSFSLRAIPRDRWRRCHPTAWSPTTALKAAWSNWGFSAFAVDFCSLISDSCSLRRSLLLMNFVVGKVLSWLGFILIWGFLLLFVCFYVKYQQGGSLQLSEVTWSDGVVSSVVSTCHNLISKKYNNQEKTFSAQGLRYVTEFLKFFKKRCYRLFALKFLSNICGFLLLFGQKKFQFLYKWLPAVIFHVCSVDYLFITSPAFHM